MKTRYLLKALADADYNDFAGYEVNLPFKDGEKSWIDIRDIAAMAKKVIEVQDNLIYTQLPEDCKITE